jgi:hypothetical protein
MFANDYLELIGVVDPEEFARAGRRSRRMDGGLAALAFATADPAVAKAELAGHGIAAEGPKNLSRLIEGDEGATEPRFLLLDLPAEASPALPMFLCHHLTPELVRRPGWTEHANGARRIASLALPVAGPETMVAAYERLLGPGAVTMTDQMVVLRTGGASIVLARPDDLPSLFPEILPEEAADCPAVVTVEVPDPDAVAHLLGAARVPFRREPGSVMVAAEDACGVALVFAP